jgi:soluble lytic murein transglycosylase-like protein
MLWDRSKRDSGLRLLASSICLALGVSSTVAWAAPEGLATVGLKSRIGLPGLPASQAAPGPLDAHDAAHYRRIFRLQEAGELGAADELIARLHDPVLLGHVQYRRYMHPTAYRSSFEELAAWLERFADHPGADRVHALALKRRPAGVARPTAPLRGYLGGSGQELQEEPRIRYRTSLERSPEDDATVREWRAGIERLVAAGQPTAAADQLARTEIVALADPVEVDLARWEIARGFLAFAEVRRGFSFARLAARRSGEVVPETHWTAGLAAWRYGRIELAARHFAALAEAEAARPSERTRAAFWAARAYLVAFKPQLVTRFLSIAAEDAHNLYGLLARTVLGREPGYDWQRAGPRDGMRQLLAQYPGARRALALGQVGQDRLAEQEIRKLAARAAPDLMTGLIALAGWLDLPAAQMRLAQSLGTSEGRYHYGALFPLPSWRPATGFTLDRALLFAVMRAESGFDSEAESGAGARGLMQVMPATAREIAARSELEPAQGDDLFEPETAMLFGQAYLEHLLQRPYVGDNLIYLAVAYNAGPGRVLRWRRDLAIDDDPLLFLESIPIPETRIYVKKVLTNLWTYRARLRQPQPSLEALARNRWPTYQALDTRATLHAWN